MENSSSDPKQINWKKKGLGWIPDYPDARDYSSINSQEEGWLRKDGNISREENLKVIENITDELVNSLKTLTKSLENIKEEKSQAIEFIADELISSLQLLVTALQGDIPIVSKYNIISIQRRIQSKITKSSIENEIKNIEDTLEKLINQVFGKIVFQKVSIYKSLRESEASSIHNVTDINSLFSHLQQPIQQVAEISDQVAQSILLLKVCLSHVLPPEELKKALKEIKLSEWLLDSRYDKPTIDLVERFQEQEKLTKDGVVGIETYIRLRQSFFGDFSCKNFRAPTVISLPPQVLQTILPLIYNISKIMLVDTIQEEVQKDVQKAFTVRFDDNLSEDFSTKIHFFQKVKGKNTTDCFNELDHLLGQTKQRETFLKVFTDAFVVIEPIIVVILQKIMPLASYSNSLRDLGNIIVKTIDELWKPDQRQSEFILDEACVEIFKHAIIKSQEIYLSNKENIFNKIATNEAQHPNNRLSEHDQMTFYVYFLIGKFIQYLADRYFEVPQQQKRYQTSNYFGKNDFLVLVNHDTPAENTQLFPIDEISIPIDRELLKNLDLENSNIAFFLPYAMDLSYWFSPIEDQGELNACTAFAGTALFEYFTNRSRGRYIDGSALFLYKSARNLMNLSNDVGASVRETMKAMALFGIPPESSWPYDPTQVDQEPPSFCYSYAQSYQTLKYFRLDHAGISRSTLLLQIKAALVAGLPSMFGFTIYTSAYYEENIRKGHIPFPNSKQDQVIGGHAIVAVGYDDYKIIDGADSTKFSRGAFLIRNSWGTAWGSQGYGWLPYDYVLQGLTRDWWSLLKTEWFNEDNFGLGSRGTGYPPWVTGQ